MKFKKPKTLLNYIFSRSVVTGLIILIQIIWVIILFSEISQYSRHIDLAFRLLSIIMAVYIIGTKTNASAKIAWVMVICLAPILGIPLYLMLGNKYTSRPFKASFSKTREVFAQYYKTDGKNIARISEKHPNISGKFRYLEQNCGFPIYDRTDITYFPLGENMFEDMLTELSSAQNHIFLEFFIIDEGRMWDSIFEILKNKSAEGVEVRLIYDDIGCIDRLPANFPALMRKYNIQTIAFNRFIPFISAVMNHRDHRKMMIIDSKVAFTGGINIADEYINENNRFGHWKDTGIKLVGDGAYGFTLLYLDMWDTLKRVVKEPVLDSKPIPIPQSKVHNDSFVQPFADSPLDNEDVSENLYLDIIGGAGKYLYIFTPYIVIDSSMSAALGRAAKRGVDVRIITPGIPDKFIVHRLTRSNYLPLISDGVKIYEYSQGFVHAKSFVSDDEIAIVGTINMDFRSLNLHFECGVLLHDDKITEQMKQDFLQTQESCKQITTDNCKTSLIGMLCDAVIRVFAPLM